MTQLGVNSLSEIGANEQCSRQPAGTTSQQRSTLPDTGGGTVLWLRAPTPSQDKCSPAGGHQVPSLPDSRPGNSH
jgi:hypothetical protein